MAPSSEKSFDVKKKPSYISGMAHLNLPYIIPRSNSVPDVLGATVRWEMPLKRRELDVVGCCIQQFV